MPKRPGLLIPNSYTMKKRLNVIVLTLEIAAISVLHARKINQTEKKEEQKAISAVYNSYKEPLKARFPYILISIKK
jgi:hypothetical protein